MVGFSLDLSLSREIQQSALSNLDQLREKASKNLEWLMVLSHKTNLSDCLLFLRSLASKPKELLVSLVAVKSVESAIFLSFLNGKKLSDEEVLIVEDLYVEYSPFLEFSSRFHSDDKFAAECKHSFDLGFILPRI